MSTSKLATPHDPVVASSALSSPSRRRFLMGGATIAAVACLPAAATGTASIKPTLQPLPLRAKEISP
jgi:hypothetical protein